MTTASKAKWALFLLLAVLLLIVAFQNLETVDVRILIWDRQLPKAVLLAVTAFIGFLMGLFARALWQMRAWHRRSKTSKTDSTNSSLV